MTEQELSTLVDPETIRKSIKRIFSNTANEILGELLQNSQRAKAKNVTINTTTTGFSYRDDGTGLQNGIESFHTLLAMAKSYFDNSTIVDQDPMGLGIHALLAHDLVSSVTFLSGNLALDIETSLWWEDTSYYKSWHERVVASPPATGFQIEVVCGKRLATEISGVLTSRNAAPLNSRTKVSDIAISCIAGYKDILKITFNGNVIDTRVPSWCSPGTVLYQGTYEGSEVTIGTSSVYEGLRSCVVWYGQIIPIDMSEFTGYGHLTFKLVVTAGHPVNPMSPSRRGIVFDTRFHEFVAWCKEEVFRKYLETRSVQSNPEYLLSLFKIDNERASETLPTYLANELSKFSESDWERRSSPKSTCSEDIVLRYDDKAPIILDGVVWIENGTHDEEYEYGLCSILEYVKKPCYSLKYADTKRVTESRLYWIPGPALSAEQYPNAEHGALDNFFLPGSYQIRKGNSAGKVEELPENAVIFAFKQQDSHSAVECEWVVGVRSTATFFGQLVYIGRNENSDDDDRSEYNFDESVAQWQRDIVGNATKSNFNFSDAQNLFPYSEHITKIEFVYGNNSSEYRSHPSDAIFTSNAGTVVKRKLMG